MNYDKTYRMLDAFSSRFHQFYGKIHQIDVRFAVVKDIAQEFSILIQTKEDD